MMMTQLDIHTQINDPLSLVDVIHKDYLEMDNRSKIRAKSIEFLEENRRKSFWIRLNQYFLESKRIHGNKEKSC